MDNNFITDWTHHAITIIDIRKLKHLYAIKVSGISQTLFVKEDIFNDRLSSYFLTDKLPERKDILSLKWNMVITEGFYIKVNGPSGQYHKINGDRKKLYVSYMDVEGALGTFETVLKDKNKKDTNERS
jgi:hypothetical protein